MLDYLLALLYLAHLAQGTSSDITSAHSCPPLDETSRSVGSILGACGITLLICVWHTIHFNVPKAERTMPLWWKVLCGIGSFFAPEVLVTFAVAEWWDARDNVNQFRNRGYEWSMAHGFFAEMGGFLYHYRDENDRNMSTTINSLSFLYLCEQNKITQPFIRAREIRDRSKSDWLGKTILALQLIWFMLQAIVRGSRGLAVTLVELDTVCMGVLSLIIIFFWWDKPLGPECPHIFYAPPEVKAYQPPYRFASLPESTLSRDMQKSLSDAWKAEPVFPDWLTSCFTRRSKYGPLTEEASGCPKFSWLMNKFDGDDVLSASLGATWMVLGGLHLIAWDFEFPTETEKTLWRVASLALAAGPIPFLGLVVMLSNNIPDKLKPAVEAGVGIAGILGVVSRAILVGLMLASLRELPCSAHQNISWTFYIPHL